VIGLPFDGGEVGLVACCCWRAVSEEERIEILPVRVMHEEETMPTRRSKETGSWPLRLRRRLW